MVRARYPGNTPPGSLARELAPQRLRELPSAAPQQDKSTTPPKISIISYLLFIIYYLKRKDSSP